MMCHVSISSLTQHSRLHVGSPFDHLTGAKLERKRLVSVIAWIVEEYRQLHSRLVLSVLDACGFRRPRSEWVAKAAKAGLSIGQHTGIELLASVCQLAMVVHRHRVTLLSLAFALHRDGDVDLELGCGNEAHGGSHQREKESSFHGEGFDEAIEEGRIV